MNQSFTLWPKGRQLDLAHFRCSKGLAVDVSETSKIGNAVLEVRIDASAGRNIANEQEWGGSNYIATPTVRVQNFTQDGKVKITKCPWCFECSRDSVSTGENIIVTFVKLDPRTALRAEVQEVTRIKLQVFNLDDAVDFETQSESDTFEHCPALNGCTLPAYSSSGVEVLLTPLSTCYHQKTLLVKSIHQLFDFHV